MCSISSAMFQCSPIHLLMCRPRMYWPQSSPFRCCFSYTGLSSSTLLTLLDSLISDYHSTEKNSAVFLQNPLQHILSHVCTAGEGSVLSKLLNTIHWSFYLLKYFSNFSLQLCLSLEPFVSSKPDHSLVGLKYNLLFSISLSSILLELLYLEFTPPLQTLSSSVYHQVHFTFSSMKPPWLPAGYGTVSLWTLILPYQNSVKSFKLPTSHHSTLHLSFLKAGILSNFFLFMVLC